MLAKPGVTLAALSSLTLAIGVNTFGRALKEESQSSGEGRERGRVRGP